MKKAYILISLILICLLLLNCEEQGENVLGSRDHDIKTITSSIPEILANGISTTTIVAVVYDQDDHISENMKVIFQTTLGRIEESAITDKNGKASVILTSVASETDLMAEVMATVVDTVFQALGKGAASSYRVTVYVPGFENKNQNKFHLKKTAQQQDNPAKIYVKFLGVTLNAEVEDAVLPADGISQTKVTIRLRETTSRKAIVSEEVNVGLKYGTIANKAKTNDQGVSELYLKSATQAAEDTLFVEYGNKLSIYLPISYKIPKLQLSSNTAQIPADGESKIQITATLLAQPQNTPIIGAKVKFSTSAGIIKESEITDEYGKAKVELIAASQPDSSVKVIANFLLLSDSVTVAFVSTLKDYPNSIILQADPNFIWVKETGNLEQTTVTATIIGVSGQPVGNDFGVKFSIINGPDGGEFIKPSSGSAWESSIIKTVDGKAEAFIRAGIRPGTVQILAELVDSLNVAAKTTNIVIRSGPAYMWINPADANDVVSHTTLTVEPGKFNVAFGNPVQEIRINAIFGDKYNNPIEQGTTVYFTTTGGIISTDATTNELGKGSVLLQNCNPFPFLESEDDSQLTSCCIPNPNDEDVMLDIEIPDFEDGLILNTLGNTFENDGVTIILAYTWGQNQNNKNVKVWGCTMVVFSQGVDLNSIDVSGYFGYRGFYAYRSKEVLKIGESATIYVRLYDIHGNPVAAGSKLTAKTTEGELSDTNLIPDPVDYGYGTTFFQTTLLNNLDPAENEATEAIVTIQLDSPNGSAKINVPIYLSIEEAL